MNTNTFDGGAAGRLAVSVLAPMVLLWSACANNRGIPPQKTEQVQKSLAAPRTICFLPWGDAEDQVATLVPKEGAPEGPMAFDIAPDGRIAILDQVHQRILFLDSSGRPRRSVALPDVTFQDLQLLDDGRTAVMDRLKHRQVLVLSPTGKILAKTPLEGPFIPEGGGVTALLTQQDGLWVEVEHRYSVLIADRLGRPIHHRIRRTGRVLADRTARLWRDSPLRASLVVEPLDGQPGQAAGISLKYPEPVRLTGLVRLSGGGFAISAVSTSRPSAVGAMDRVYVDFINSPGRTKTRRWTTSIPAMPEEIFQVLRPTPKGGAALMHIEDQGLEIQEVRP